MGGGQEARNEGGLQRVEKSLRACREERKPAGSLIFAQWDLLQMFNLQNSKIINMDCGTSLVVQLLTLHAPNPRGPGFQPWSGN